MITTLETGRQFPAVDLVSASGAETTLAAEIGGRIAVVHVMRSSSCPVCLAHAAALQRLLDSGSLGDAVAVLIAPGGAAEAEDAASRAGRRSPVAFLQQSATIVVAAVGTVRSIRASTLPTGSVSADEVRTAVADALRAGVITTRADVTPEV